MHSSRPTDRREEAGFTLLEAVVALGVIAMVVTSFLGIRTSAVADGIEARNWRLAREIAEERMSELLAGAFEVPPESGYDVPLDEKYPGFHYRIYIGENAVSQMETEIASAQSGEAGERSEWQRNRDLYRKASSRGLNAIEYEDQIREEEHQREMANKAPSDSEFEQVAVVTFFPKVNGDYPGHEETFVIKARASTLALSGMTPEQAKMIADSQGEGSTSGDGSAGGGLPLGGGK